MQVQVNLCQNKPANTAIEPFVIEWTDFDGGSTTSYNMDPNCKCFNSGLLWVDHVCTVATRESFTCYMWSSSSSSSYSSASLSSDNTSSSSNGIASSGASDSSSVSSVLSSSEVSSFVSSTVFSSYSSQNADSSTGYSSSF